MQWLNTVRGGSAALTPAGHGARRGLCCMLAAAALGLLAVGPVVLGSATDAEAKEKTSSKDKKDKKDKKEPVAKGKFEYGCRVQKPQAFLMRRTFVKKGTVDPKKQIRALRWLADHYGHADDTLTRSYNANSARGHATTVKFMGLPLQIHEDIAPALSCVEKRIQKSCKGSSRYLARAVGGFRSLNTYRGPEISNHLFGIAIDIDPDKNPCCGCVDPWPNNPLCSLKAKTVYDRTSLPKCWVKAFERFGFDWLGHDALEDTMHFEFLGDPDRIKRKKK